jgi:zinc protease
MIWNGTTSDERVNYFFTLGSAQLEEGAKFMADAIMTPLFDEGELVKERQVVLGEVDRNESSPYFHLYRALQEKMFWKFPTRKDTLGDRKTIETATRDKMVTVQKKFYVPNNSALILAGDVTPEQGFALAAKFFGEWQRAEDPFKLSPVPKHPPITKTEAIIVNQKVEAVSVSIGLHGPSVKTDPGATYAADVFSFILGQKGSKFHKAMVDSGLTLGTSLSYYTLTHTGPINITFRTTPDKVEAAVAAVKAEVAKFNEPDYFTDEQLETAKTLLAVESIFSREQTSSYAHTVSFWWAVAGLDYYKNYVDNLKKVTRADMARYVTTYIHGKPYVMAILISPESQKQIQLTDKKAASWASPIKAAQKGK